MNDFDQLPLATGPSVDLNKVGPLSQQRSVSFMNKFLVNTADFLNNFSALAEENLVKQASEMQKLEVAINILETKLASIPGLEDSTPIEAKATPEQSSSSTEATDVPSNPPQPREDPAPSNVLTVKDDPRYAKYLKMINVGVPKVAVEGKMKAEGLDPNLLSTPDAPVPDACPNAGDSEDQTSSSGDDFSD